MNFTNKTYLLDELPNQLRQLKANQEPNFGLMTAQHMVEHLIWTTKVFSARKSEPTGEPTRSALSFQRFIAKGLPFEYRAKEDAVLKPLRFGSLEEAIVVLEETNIKLYQHFEANPTYKSFNSFTGEFDVPQLDLFMGQHAKWHAFQFGLIEEYA